MNKLKLVHQLDEMDCGPSCLTMIVNYYGVKASLDYIRNKCYLTKNGVSLLGISQSAEELGFETFSVRITLNQLKTIQLPCILHWNNAHFVVLSNIKYKNGKVVYRIADPAHGYVNLEEKEFLKNWSLDNEKGVCLILYPSSIDFYDKKIVEKKKSYKFLFKYLKPFKSEICKIFIGLFLGCIITLALPFLTQYMVDSGIKNKDLNILQLIFIFQVSLFIGNSVIDILRNRLFLHIGTRVNINIISDFLSKLMEMPIKYFDSKSSGDLIQRIEDHKRIEEFITSNALLTIFSLINFSVFFIILAFYDIYILIIYLILTIVSIFWVLFFQKNRRKLDYKRFDISSENQSNTYEMINGIEEILLNGIEDYKINKWKNIQEKLYLTNLKVLNIDQLQLNGFNLINNLKNIVITYLVAVNVVNNNLTLGNMLSISYIVGQMNSPINQLISFFRTSLDAKLSFNRLNEIHNENLTNSKGKDFIFNNSSILISNLSFQYEGPKSPFVLNGVSFSIKKGETTAIVGQSGSGKTTLMKILLKYYEPTLGDIKIDNTNIKEFSFNSWKENYGVVMQDGFIFSDTIERNIISGEKEVDNKRLDYAASMSNIKKFVESLPMKYKTKIGESGMKISGGQKQRILLARAIYKDPHYIFLDEATSSLDTENENIIHKNLQEVFKNKTVLIIAHRLSTVKKSDNIIVLKNGRVAEQGNHKELVAQKKEYYNLIKNQLELDN